MASLGKPSNRERQTTNIVLKPSLRVTSLVAKRKQSRRALRFLKAIIVL